MQLPRTREWREAAGLTQRQLSKESGVGKGTIVRIENGESATPRTAKKIADTLNISVADLLESPPVPLGQAQTSYKPPEEAEEKGLREELLEEERGAYEEQRHTADEVEEAGLTDTELLHELVSPASSEAEAARKKKRFLQYNRVMIVISALEELVDHVELVLSGDSASLQEIESLEEIVSAQFFVHKRYARNEVLEQGTSRQKAALKHEEARMEAALEALQEALQEAYRERLERDAGVSSIAKYQANKAEREKLEQLEREAGESAG